MTLSYRRRKRSSVTCPRSHIKCKAELRLAQRWFCVNACGNICCRELNQTLVAPVQCGILQCCVLVVPMWQDSLVTSKFPHLDM